MEKLLLHSKRAPLKAAQTPVQVTLIIVFNDFSFIKVMSNEVELLYLL
jgi:hypothetical protein